MFQALDSPDKSDSEGQDGREEELVDVENMEHRYRQHARWRNWLVADDGGRSKEEPKRSPRTEQRSGRWSERRSSLAEYVARHRAVPFVVVVVSVSLISVSGNGSAHSPESVSSQAGHQSSEPGEGG